MRRWLAFGIMLMTASLALGAATALGEKTTLLSATAPGAYAVRYWPDRIVLTYDAPTDVGVSVLLPQAPRWARCDDTRLSSQKIRWEAAASCVTLQLPAGRHTVHIGWQGAYQPAPRLQPIPVWLDGKKVGTLTARFTLEKMEAEGFLPAPAALLRAKLHLSAKADPRLSPVLAANRLRLDRWQRKGGELIAARLVPTVNTLALQLSVEAYALTSSPIASVAFETAQKALAPKRLAAMPEEGIIIEAEDFCAEGLGKVEISDRHFQTHGGKSIYNNSGDGHWLEYRFNVPRAGLYDLYVRAATQEPYDLRSLQIDGQTPPGLGLIEFPGTGGWGYSGEEWAALQLTGLPEAPSLQLDVGEHRLRITGEGATHLNLDYFVLQPRR